MSIWSDWYWDERFAFAFLILGWTFVALAIARALAFTRRWWRSRRATPSCDRCSYDLRGLTPTGATGPLTCPECGQAQPTTSAGRPRLEWRRPALHIAALLIAAQTSSMARTACLHGPARLLPDRVLVWVLNTWPERTSVLYRDLDDRLMHWEQIGGGDATGLLTIKLKELVPTRSRWLKGERMPLQGAITFNLRRYCGLSPIDWTTWSFELVPSMIEVDLEWERTVFYVTTHRESERPHLVPLDLSGVKLCDSIDEVISPVTSSAIDDAVQRTMNPRLLIGPYPGCCIEYTLPAALRDSGLALALEFSLERNGVQIRTTTRLLKTWEVDGTYPTCYVDIDLDGVQLGTGYTIVVKGAPLLAMRETLNASYWSGRAEWPLVIARSEVTGDAED